MQPSEKQSNKPDPITTPQGVSPTKTNEYSLHCASVAVERQFIRAYEKIPAHDLKKIKDAIRGLKADPRQAGKKIKAIPIESVVAGHRLRVGDYRIFYDIDDTNRRVVLLLIARRNE